MFTMLVDDQIKIHERLSDKRYSIANYMFSKVTASDSQVIDSA